MRPLQFTLRTPARSSRSGFTLIEFAVVVAILTVAMAMFAQILSASARLDPAARESWLASNGAYAALERVRARDVNEIFALFNASQSDDPAGPGTAPGRYFDVEGLTPCAPGEHVGRIEFPEVSGHVRETSRDAELGFPRDISGDGVIDERDHESDWVLLPVRVKIEWAPVGAKGTRRTFSMCTMISRVRLPS